MLKHFLISTDGSPVSNKAVKAGIALANALGAKVTAYCAPKEVQPIYVEGSIFDQLVIDRFEDAARRVGQKRVDAIGKIAVPA
jgi:nucleotide-binding universal stress UspA family protein